MIRYHQLTKNEVPFREERIKKKTIEPRGGSNVSLHLGDLAHEKKNRNRCFTSNMYHPKVP